MSLYVAIPCGIAAALAYGAATAAQHAEAHTGTGEVDARGLLALLRNPRWLLAVAGDGVGLVLQVIALSTGAVVLVQPLLVLSVPVALFVGAVLGGPRPQRSDQLAAAGIVVGLGAFFALVGDPGNGIPFRPAPAAVTIVVALAAGASIILCVRGTRTSVHALGLGLVAGGFFGLVGVLLNAVAETYSRDGLDGFAHADALVPLVGVLVLGALAMVATQASFQVGVLAASFPANESTAPLVAVLLGALLLHENMPVGPAYLAGYLACFALVVAGTVWLARDRPRLSSPAQSTR